MELIAGLNEMGIVPDLVWDEPQDWDALGNPELLTAYSPGRLAISSQTLRRLPPLMSRLLRTSSVRFSRLGLERFDFVFSFEPEIRMPKGVPNICWLTGPHHVRMPEERPVVSRLYRPREVRKLVGCLTSPLLGPDKHSRYVTHSEWIAALFFERYGISPPVIWPPSRSRALPDPPGDRAGFLFLSRLVEPKRADAMITLAAAYPDEQVTIAGVVLGSSREYVNRLEGRISDQRLSNVEIIENPTEERVAELLTSHGVFVFPAPWEHFGIVTVEAIAAGLLPLVHDTGGQREIVPFENLRFSSEHQLIECAGRVLAMPQTERQQIVEQLRRHVDRGSPERYRQEMLKDVKALQESR